jgi:soluble lytic murein transglycosylase-like protein
MKLWTEKPGFPPGRGCAALRPSFGGSLRMAVPYLACMLAAAQYYHLPPHVLPSIQAVEGGYTGASHLNTDQSVDLGVMQINTRWVQPLATAIHWRPEAVQSSLMNDPCFNIAAAAAILDVYRHEDGGDIMRAIGDYHSHTASLNKTYQDLVMSHASALFGNAP